MEGITKYDLIMSGDKLEPYWLNKLLEDAEEAGIIYSSRLDSSKIIGNIIFENVAYKSDCEMVGYTEILLKDIKLFSIKVLVGDESIMIYHQLFGWIYPMTFKAIREVLNFILELWEFMAKRVLTQRLKEESSKCEEFENKISDYEKLKKTLDSFKLGIEIVKCAKDQYTDKVDNLATDQWGGAGPDCSPVLKGVQQNKE